MKFTKEEALEAARSLAVLASISAPDHECRDKLEILQQCIEEAFEYQSKLNETIEALKEALAEQEQGMHFNKQAQQRLENAIEQEKKSAAAYEEANANLIKANADREEALRVLEEVKLNNPFRKPEGKPSA